MNSFGPNGTHDFVGEALGHVNGHDGRHVQPSRQLEVRGAADITPRQIDFIWPGRLARGKHTAFAGEPGDGKSQLSVYVAAIVSTGGEWPCGEGRAPIGNVVIFNAEDGADDTIVPRLIAASAGLERVHIVNAVRIEGKGHQTFNLQIDLALLEQEIAKIGDVALVIIDPISSYMGKTDSHKNSEVRGALEPLSEMAERLKVAILSITHFSKAGSGGGNTKALHRFIGSIAFVGAPRAAFAVIEDADNEGRMLVLHAKNNMAPKPQGLAYRLLQTIVCDNIVASYVEWDSESVTISANEALGAAETSSNSRTAREKAEDFLRDRLASGPVPQKDVKADADGAGIAWATIRRAKEHLGIEPHKDGMGGGWTWALPKVLKSLEDAHVPEVSTFDANEHLRDDAPALGPPGDSLGDFR
jgi:RecA-family ATPase